MKAEIEQTQLRGDFEFAEASRLDFGVSLTDVKNRSAYANVQQDSWGGATSAADYPDDLWHPDTIRHYFDNISGSSNPNLFNNFFTWDFESVRAIAARVGDPKMYQMSTDYQVDRRVKEKSKSAYLQYSTSWELLRPMNGALGVRYEKTDVTSDALVPAPTGILWVAANEFSLQAPQSQFEQRTGSYDYVLPSLDLSMDVTESFKARASWGKSIGRPGWGAIQGGETLDQLVRINGGTGKKGNPGLKPLLSKNIDLSLEWYYARGSYASVGFFRKDIDNYVGITTVTESPAQLYHPGQGAWYNEAVANSCPTKDNVCIRNYIFTHHANSPGVKITGTAPNGDILGTIAGQPGDPIATFEIQVPANQRSATLHGWELNIQHMFGESGFGASANYTIVDSGLRYDNYNRGEQFALEGLSDSANLVAFYEKHGWQIRAAYNWRDEFLFRRVDGTGLPNPIYTEPYGQLDLNISYAFTENLTFMAEAINLTDEIQRLHGRTKDEVIQVTQTGPRYMLGARYKFGK
jgi:TonB-dependent receptor